MIMMDNQFQWAIHCYLKEEYEKIKKKLKKREEYEL